MRQPGDSKSFRVDAHFQDTARFLAPPAEERLLAANARIRELEAQLAETAKERDEWRATAEVLQEGDAMAALFADEKDRAEKAEAELARVRAELARVCEAKQP